MSKTLSFIVGCLALANGLPAQNHLRNFGPVQIHTGGQLGLYVNFINDGVFRNNTGLTGFYGDFGLTTSGINLPEFGELEIALENDLIVESPLLVLNHINFIYGDFICAEPLASNLLYVAESSTHSGSSDLSKVQGYVRMLGQANFLFPVGDNEQLRPLIIASDAVQDNAQCAYYYGNPEGFDAGPGTAVNTRLSDELSAISAVEFWHLVAEGSAGISLDWNARSGLAALADGAEDICLAGWNPATQQWEAIATTEKSGTATEGYLQSVPFIPNTYAALTFGILRHSNDDNSSNNYALSPNGDGYNDTLVLEETAVSTDNRLLIFNRWGQKVYESANYQNDFDGRSNSRGIIYGREKGLQSGVYFYIFYMNDLEITVQGYLYLAK